MSMASWQLLVNILRSRHQGFWNSRRPVRWRHLWRYQWWWAFHLRSVRPS